jgi:hypothetical protein
MRDDSVMSATRLIGGRRAWRRTVLWTLAVMMAAISARPADAAGTPAKRTKPAKRTAAPAAPLPMEAKAIELLKATSARLAAAHTLRFTAVVSYESPSVLGPPLLYTTSSDVVVERPDKLRVLTAGDGNPSALYDDGKTLVAFAPKENLVAVADAPPTIDAAVKLLYDASATYLPYSDLIVADPYKDIAEDLKLAFYIGQSNVVGGTTTDMVAYASDSVFVQIWIGAEDKLPRMLRAVYAADPKQLRHQLELSNWQLDLSVPPDAFNPGDIVRTAQRIQFGRPDPVPMATGRPSRPAQKK